MHGDLIILDATIAQLGGDRQNNYARSSDAYIESGSFLRFKNISLGYTLPKNVSKKLAWKNYVSMPHYKTILPLQNTLGVILSLGSTWGVFVQKADLGKLHYS